MPYFHRTLLKKNGMGFGIYLSQVIQAYRASGTSGHSPYFELTYRKADGSFGQTAFLGPV